jgi:4-hydroxy-2-oxoheptanedioate aldolase
VRGLVSEATLKLGAWCGIPSSYTVELMCAAGYDWICIDTQHGMIDYPSVRGMLQASSIRGLPALVRVPSAEDTAAIMRALDAGAAGVLVPMVSTAQEARAAVSACRYPPAGTRSWGPARALPSGPGFSPEAANQHVICAVQIETLEALENLGDILAVDGVDVAFVGPADLALAMGLRPAAAPQRGEHAAAIEMVARRARQAGVRAGVYGGSPEIVAQYVRLGYDFVAAANDAQLLSQWARHTVDTVRAAAANPDPPLTQIRC